MHTLSHGPEYFDKIPHIHFISAIEILFVILVLFATSNGKTEKRSFLRTLGNGIAGLIILLFYGFFVAMGAFSGMIQGGPLIVYDGYILLAGRGDLLFPSETPIANRLNQ